MQFSTEEFLYFLLWTADTLTMRPTWRNLNDPFEIWVNRNGLSRRLRYLEQEKLLERHPAAELGRVVRLTETGRVAAMGGRDPLERWARAWDGRWRMVLFDLPSKKRGLRMRWWRHLRAAGFGYLQNSVWITPDSLAETERVLARESIAVETLTLFEGRPAGGETDAQLVTGAWDFAQINSLYEQHLRLLRDAPTTADIAVLHEWVRRERTAWHAAVRLDPLLPQTLLPPDYAGKKAWAARRQAFAKLGQLLVKPAEAKRPVDT
ncbi:MAG TPA: PaaX family transcriptional regulator C-terminal domain-containing protein [Opitutaceae bacterium]|nr:PaaX family transcriptional regulator C-terminal domain-containing protein [Opitutaceae bacterium]